MNHLNTWTFAVLLFAPLAACGHSDDMMSGDYVSMQATLADAQAENQRHAEACETASSMPTMMDELTRHEKAMDGIMAHMDDARGHMGDGSTGMGMRRCTGPDFDHMSRAVDDLHSMMSEHSTVMVSVEDLDAARSECSSHTGEMDDSMQGMMSDLESMSCAER